MGMNGIGSYTQYTYNFATGKLSSEDESDQLFVKYFNGELDTDGDHLPKELTGFDYRKRGEIRWNVEDYCRMFPDKCNGDLELGVEIVHAGLWKISRIEDDEVSVCNSYGGEIYLPEELHSPLNGQVDFATQESEEYNAQTNSIKIGVGSSFELLKGYTFTIEKNKVTFQRDKKAGDMQTDLKAGAMCQYLEAFMYFADQKCGSRSIYSIYNGNEYNHFLQKFLSKLGVDTSKEFIVNETRCVFRDNQFVDADYDYENGMTGARGVYEKAIERYEKVLYAPIEKDPYYQKSM